VWFLCVVNFSKVIIYDNSTMSNLCLRTAEQQGIKHGKPLTHEHDAEEMDDVMKVGTLSVGNGGGLDDRDKEENTDDSSAINVVAPLLKSMWLFGIYVHPDKSDEKSKKCRQALIYPVCVLVIQWCNFVRLLSVFQRTDTFSAPLIVKLFSLAWILQCTISHTVFFVASYTGRHEARTVGVSSA